MGKIFLVGIIHADDESGSSPDKVRSGKLISPSIEKEFEEEILPLISNDSLLLKEGGFCNHLLTPSMVDYEKSFGHLSQNSLKWPVRPTLGLVDPRQTQEGMNATYAYIAQILPEAVEAIHTEDIPATVDAVLNFIRKGRFPCVVKKKPMPSHWKKVAQIALKGFEQFDRAHIKAVNEYGDRFGNCILVVGSSHAISLHLKTGWPLKALVRPGSVAVDLARMMQGYAAWTAHGSIILQAP